MIIRKAPAVCWLVAAMAGAFAFSAQAAPKPTPVPVKKPSGSAMKSAPKKAPKPDAKGRGRASKPAPIKPAPIKPTPATPAQPDPELAKYSTINSLGMRFVKVGDVEFCIWPVRVRDYTAYWHGNKDAARSALWQKPGFAQTSEHPVVCVTWDDAVKYCHWLTKKERAEKRLSTDREYRLPTDIEWSRAVALPEEKGSSPAERDLRNLRDYPWGTQWPPPPGAGNFAGEETREPTAIPGYRDNFVNTSPVGSFAPNAAGLFDMAGNVWQWCRDPWFKDSRERTLRGASWFNGALPISLLSSARIRFNPETPSEALGFRIVIAPVEKK